MRLIKICLKVRLNITNLCIEWVKGVEALINRPEALQKWDRVNIQTFQEEMLETCYKNKREMEAKMLLMAKAKPKCGLNFMGILKIKIETVENRLIIMISLILVSCQIYNPQVERTFSQKLVGSKSDALVTGMQLT